MPANRPLLFAKAAAGPADAVVLDLEDAVPIADKSTARLSVREFLDSLPDVPNGAQIWVRVDPTSLDADVEAVVRLGLSGILLAKCSIDALDQLAALLDRLEAERGVTRLPVVGLVEDAAAILSLADLARHHRLTTFAVGEVDLLGDLRLARTPDTATAVVDLRLQVVLHAAAARLPAPVAPTSTDFRDLDTFERSTRELVDLGFRSRTAIHPGQVPVIHHVLAPDDGQIATAQDVLDRFNAANGGVTVDANGRLIDAAVIRAARETLQRA
ncbi:aldolase/citrate lyase family protein [Gordonia sp. HY366]|uniref:Aldolase/citrate lyase family protein n=1 Tax=Gordonia liuliyuniae TaxID=2911517 RepID=A0ABS9IWT0_9ACTN|nr:aldolase/citrate lyase family protein [Gordonia liuliyuniae]